MCNGTKTAIGLFLINSGASVTHKYFSKYGICPTYQTLYNGLEDIANNHQLRNSKIYL
jgi:hypothetical protein